MLHNSNAKTDQAEKDVTAAREELRPALLEQG